MKFFDRLFGKVEPPISDPDRLRAELFAAAGSGSVRRLDRLARANEAAVVAHFDSWRKVPEAVRVDSAATQSYVNSMIAVAQHFAERLGRPELMAALVAPADGNPIVRWQESLRRARELLDNLRYDEARSILADALIDARGMSGTGVATLSPVTQGYLAESYFHAGRAAEAIPHLENALHTCEGSGDAEGVFAYLRSLFEAHRYLGQTEQAARDADSLAEVGPEKDASR